MRFSLVKAGLLLAAVASIQPFRPFVVSGDSMSPTLGNGQLLLARIRPNGLARGDVVVFRHQGETMVKRVAYLPGDSTERFWFANEWQFPASERSRKVLTRTGARSRHDIVPEGTVFVLADNPSGSIDSRTLGPIPADEVIGVVPDVDSSAEWTLDGAKEGAAIVASL